eukprot:UN26050
MQDLRRKIENMRDDYDKQMMDARSEKSSRDDELRELQKRTNQSDNTYLKDIKILEEKLSSSGETVSSQKQEITELQTKLDDIQEKYNNNKEEYHKLEISNENITTKFNNITEQFK